MEYSLIICTYNPNPGLLLRCFNAVAALKHDTSFEVIVVDNNSRIPVRKMDGFDHFFKAGMNWTILEETKQGNLHARIAGIKKATGKYVVFIDDDNEPESSYLLQLNELRAAYPNVRAWGPGIVDVEFTEGIAEHLTAYASIAFQERREQGTRYAAEKEWQSSYPFGTGLCMELDVLKHYVDQVEKGSFTLFGRKARQLSSGDDTQMVLFCIKMGYAAGVSALLKIKHLIPGNRTTVDYLKRLAYGTSSCYASCLLQVFPEKRSMLEAQLMKPRQFVKKSFRIWLKTISSRNDLQQFELAFFLGNHSGPYLALNRVIPLPVRWIISRSALK